MASIDWHELACEPAVRELGALARRAFGVWFGFLDADGVVVPIGDRQVALSKPPCEQIRVNSLDHPDDETTSCLDSVRGWADRVRDEGAFRTRCHAGFDVSVRSLETEEGELLGSLYVSGYFDADEAEDRRDELRETLAFNEMQELVDDGAVEAIPEVDRAGRELLELVIERIEGIVRKFVEERTDEDGNLTEGAPPRFEGMIGDTPEMRRLFEDLATISDSDSTVLVQGENGTGKELIARALHRRSPRSSHDFVALNCAAIPNQLIESELFGHKKGAFSGAHRDRDGLCVEADRGTLFLDEIGDMERSLQSKLLRFLQNGEFSPVGSSKSRSVDVRVICATNQDLEASVESGEFRKDLYFRINVIQLNVPPLRERRGDIPVLIDHFLNKSAKHHGVDPPELSEECRAQLLAHDWPGNVRELENEIERLVIMAGGDGTIDVDELSPRIGGEPDVDAVPAFEGMTIPEATERLERKMILDGLRETGWNKTQTAKDLGVSRRNLIRKVSQYELEQYRDDES